MKHFAFLAVFTLLAIGGGIFAPVLIVGWYYFLALLRPQFVWDWSLSGEVRWSLVAGLGAIVAVLLNLKRYMDRMRLNLPMTLMIVFGMVILLSGVTARDPGVAMPWVIEYGKILLMALVACVVIEKLSYAWALVVMVTLVMAYVAWSVNRNYFFSDYQMRLYEHGYGGYDNNGAGLLLAVGLPMAYAAVACGTGAWRWVVRGIAAIAALMMLHAVMLSYSRGAMVALTVGLVWLVLRHTPRKQTIALAGVLVVVVLAMAGQQIREEYLSTMEYHDDATAQLRFDSWQAAWRIAVDNPVLGVGIRNSNVYSKNFGSDRYGRTIHNQYLQTAADAGIPAMLLFVAILGAVMLCLHRARRMSLAALERVQNEHSTLAVSLRQVLRMSIGLEAAIVTFSVGAMFLSLETFEFAWLILALGTALPGLVRRRIAEGEEDDQANATERNDTAADEVAENLGLERDRGGGYVAGVRRAPHPGVGRKPAWAGQ
ncbi:MAG: O-antigen ligase family protein [Phycisphaeraceae bacterium]